jgi:hypothetical protein
MVRMRMKDAGDMVRRSMKTREEDDVVGMKNTKERGEDLTMVADAITRRESTRVKEGYVALRKDTVERHTRREVVTRDGVNKPPMEVTVALKRAVMAVVKAAMEVTVALKRAAMATGSSKRRFVRGQRKFPWPCSLRS